MLFSKPDQEALCLNLVKIMQMLYIRIRHVGCMPLLKGRLSVSATKAKRLAMLKGKPKHAKASAPLGVSERRQGGMRTSCTYMKEGQGES